MAPVNSMRRGLAIAADDRLGGNRQDLTPLLDNFLETRLTFTTVSDPVVPHVVNWNSTPNFWLKISANVYLDRKGCVCFFAAIGGA